jgi:iron-sulfur cluster repair protein YtfE (RIC family)
MNAMRAKPVASTAPSRIGVAGGFTALDACHRQTFSMLDELSALVTRLEHEGPDAETRVRAAKIAAFFSTTAREHHEDEERHIFPALVKGAKPEIVQAVVRLQQDHDWIEEGWFELAPHVAAIAAGRHSYDLETMRESIAVLAALYHDHIELEESFIYPEARARMPSDGQREMGREMAARHHAERVARHAR